MKIKVFAFGKIKNPEIKELEAYYFELSKRFFKIEIIELKEIADRKIILTDIAKLLEGKNNILLSEDGKEFTTAEFSNFLYQKKYNAEDINFFIGNAFGFDFELKQKASLIFSLSKMTFPHEMARVMLLEQIFRSGDILAGGKYHK